MRDVVDALNLPSLFFSQELHTCYHLICFEQARHDEAYTLRIQIGYVCVRAHRSISFNVCFWMRQLFAFAGLAYFNIDTSSCCIMNYDTQPKDTITSGRCYDLL